MGVPDSKSWEEQYAYSVGLQAYVYAYPLLYLTQLRHRWVTDPTSQPHAPINELGRFGGITDDTYTSGGTPNTDTVYAWGIFDVAREPVVIAHPDFGDRYFTFELTDFYGDNFAYIGKRTTGSRAGRFLLVGPGWSGVTPDDAYDGVFRSPTPAVMCFERTFITGPEELEQVNALQDRITITPLSQLHAPGGSRTIDDTPAWPPFDPATDPLADFRTIARAMGENPPPRRDDPLIALFGTAGIGPGRDVDALSQATRDGLARAAADGAVMVNSFTREAPHLACRQRVELPAEGVRHAGPGRGFPRAGGRRQGRHHLQRPPRGHLPERVLRLRRPTPDR